MQVSVNGKMLELAEGTNVAQLIEAQGQRPEIVAVELNFAILPREEYEATQLHGGDEVEIVCFMGGGA